MLVFPFFGVNTSETSNNVVWCRPLVKTLAISNKCYCSTNLSKPIRMRQLLVPVFELLRRRFGVPGLLQREKDIL
jgi:hypothetical protein